MRRALVVRTPRIDYLSAWAAQQRTADRVRAGEIPAVVWLLEHDPVYTYGRHGTRADLFVDDDSLAALGATCVPTDRGGQMTWHGPGQLTGYVITDLRPGRGVRRFVEGLVGAIADATQIAGVVADNDSMGAYREGRKLGSVGIRVIDGVTMHGVGLNRDPDLVWFQRMTACGAPGVATTSIDHEGGDPTRSRVEDSLAAALADRLGLVLEDADQDVVLGGVNAA